MPSTLTQEDAARLMYAAGRWASAEGVYYNTEAYGTREERLVAVTRCREAEQAFADLIATLVEPEP